MFAAVQAALGPDTAVQQLLDASRALETLPSHMRCPPSGDQDEGGKQAQAAVVPLFLQKVKEAALRLICGSGKPDR